MSAPNIIFILSDDHGPWAMGCAGNHELQTPNLDRLAETGTRFDNFFCTSPVCSPARASLLTGRIPSQHGVHDWLKAGDTIAKYEPLGDGTRTEYLAGMPGYTDYLAEAGYTCGLSGKWHLGDSHRSQKSFTYWAPHAKGGGPYIGAPMIRDGEVYEESRYVTDVITDNALTFLEGQKEGNSPFYLSVNYTAPHSPWKRDQHPAELFDHYYNNCPFESVPSGLTPPDWVKFVSMPKQAQDPEERRIALSGYYASITAMDQNIGRLLDWLEAHQLRENTLVVFSGDNGMHMGHHGMFGKGNASLPMNMFDEAVKVPFIASQPGRIPQGILNTDLVSQYDFMPTLLEYSGVNNPTAGEGLPGVSFAGALDGKPQENHDHLVVYDEYGPVRMVRTEDWKYVHRYITGPNELYHLKNDPGEMENLAGNPEYAAQEKELRGCLEDWFEKYVNPELDGRDEHICGDGQLGLCSSRSQGKKAFATWRLEQIE